MGVDIHYESVSASDLASFDSAFISGTSPKVMPVASIGEIKYDVNDRILRKLMERYDQMCRDGE